MVNPFFPLFTTYFLLLHGGYSVRTADYGPSGLERALPTYDMSIRNDEVPSLQGIFFSAKVLLLQHLPRENL